LKWLAAAKRRKLIPIRQPLVYDSRMDENPYKSPEQTGYLPKPPSDGSPRRDFSPLVAKYLFWLGIVCLFGLRFEGFLWIWFASKVKAHNPKFRLATIILSGFYCAVTVAVFVFVLAWKTEGVMMTSPYLVHVPQWLALAFLAVTTVLHGIPLVLLLDPATKSHFSAKNASRE